MDLLELRKEIDRIDDQLIPLLMARMDVSEQVAKYKVERGIPVLNEERERQILDDVAGKCGDRGETIKTVFAATMDASRALQHKMMDGGADLRKEITAALQDGPIAVAPGECIACAGVEGAYASIAGARLFPGVPIKYYKYFENVFEAVDKGEARYGIIPVENSTAGSVHESYDLIMKYRFFMVGARDEKIEHCLAAHPDTRYEDVESIYSHHQALTQCSNFIENFGFTGITYSNTAAAAKYVAQSDRRDIAAICSPTAAKKYGLQVMKREIQNISNNRTRFVVISKDMQISSDADKISLIFRVPHTTGSLYRVLGRFSMAGLNLTKIESRPMGNGEFSYFFYVDIMGSVRRDVTLDLLCALSDELPGFKFLGTSESRRTDPPQIREVTPLKQQKRHRTNFISGVIALVTLGLLVLLAVALYKHTELEVRFDALISWLRRLDESIVGLDSDFEIILCIFALYVAKCQLPIPMGVLCVISGVVFPLGQAMLINMVFLAFFFAVKYAEGSWIGGGWAGMILNIRQMRFIRDWIRFKGNGNPYVLFVSRLVPSIPLGMVSKYYGSMHYDFLYYICLSLLGFAPRLYIYTKIGTVLYNPFSARFIALLMIIVGFSGITSMAFNIYYGRRSRQMNQTLLLYSEKEKYKIVL